MASRLTPAILEFYNVRLLSEQMCQWSSHTPPPKSLHLSVADRAHHVRKEQGMSWKTIAAEAWLVTNPRRYFSRLGFTSIISQVLLTPWIYEHHRQLFCSIHAVVTPCTPASLSPGSSLMAPRQCTKAKLKATAEAKAKATAKAATALAVARQGLRREAVRWRRSRFPRPPLAQGQHQRDRASPDRARVGGRAVSTCGRPRRWDGCSLGTRSTRRKGRDYISKFAVMVYINGVS